jgi:hypothetical protein
LTTKTGWSTSYNALRRFLARKTDLQHIPPHEQLGFAPMALKTKLAELVINETSGVDHPAHLHEGWLVIKSAAEAAVAEGETLDLEITAEAEMEAPVEAAAPVETEILKQMTDLRKELADLRKEKERIEAERELEKATEDAHAWATLPEMNPAEFAPVLVSLRKASPETATLIENILTSSARALSEAGVLKEVGTSSAETAGSAWAKIEAMANDMVANGTATSFAKAVSLVAASNMDLYTDYLNEKGL